jgi:type II secretory pathway pseudopilin PulG
MSTFYGETNMDGPRQTGWWGRNWGCLVPVGLVILVALIVVPNINFDPAQIRKQETVNKQMRLIAAIDAYRKTTGAVPNVVFDPDSSDPDQREPARQIALLLAKLRGAGPDDPVYKATKPFLGDDPERSTRDAYGNAMLYLKDGGVGGKPVIVSAGPDGKFGYGGKTDGATTNAPVNKQTQKDNIRSDMN